MLSPCFPRPMTKQVCVLEPGHSCPMLGSSEKPLLGDSSLAWLNISQNCNESKLFPIQLAFLPILLSQSDVHCTQMQVLPSSAPSPFKLHRLIPACQPLFLERPELTQLGPRTASLPTQRAVKKPAWVKPGAWLYPSTMWMLLFSTPIFFGQNVCIYVWIC